MESHIVHKQNSIEYFDTAASKVYLSLSSTANEQLALGSTDGGPIQIDNLGSINNDLTVNGQIASSVDSGAGVVSVNTNGLDESKFMIKASGINRWSISHAPFVEGLSFGYVPTGKIAAHLTNNGRLGVNDTTAPTESLDVSGSINASGEYKIAGQSVVSSNTLGSGVTQSSLESLGPQSSTLDLNGNAIHNANQIGIGTSTPHCQLHLANAAANRKIVLYEQDDNDHQFLGIGVNSGVFRFQLHNTASNYVWYAAVDSTASNELMRLTSAGNLGINVVSPTYRLDVKGTANNYRPSATTTDVISRFASDVSASNTTQVEIRANGDIYHTGGIFALSDQSFKENISDCPSKWDIVKSLRVREFNWKTDPDSTVVGLIAQECNASEIAKDVVIDGVSVKAIRTDQLEMKMLKVIQELQTRVETLEATLAPIAALNLPTVFPNMFTNYQFVISEISQIKVALQNAGLL